MFEALKQMIADLFTDDDVMETHTPEPEYTPGNRIIYGATIEPIKEVYKPPQLIEDYKIQSNPNEYVDKVRLKVFLRNYYEVHKKTNIKKTSDIPYIKLCKHYMQYLANRIYDNQKVRPTYVQLWNMLPDDCHKRDIEDIFQSVYIRYYTSKRQMKYYCKNNY
jgi:hypothetical protein